MVNHTFNATQEIATEEAQLNSETKSRSKLQANMSEPEKVLSPFDTFYLIGSLTLREPHVTVNKR